LNVPESPAKSPQRQTDMERGAMERENARMILIVTAKVYHDGPHGRLVIVETGDDQDDRADYRFKSIEAAADFIRDVLRDKIPEPARSATGLTPLKARASKKVMPGSSRATPGQVRDQSATLYFFPDRKRPP
jgi:hypothetical protein